MTNATIIGNYGTTNLGDEAILQNILASHPTLNFTVFSHNPEWTERHYAVKATYPLPFGIRSFLRGNFKTSFQALKNSDLVILGGGGLFTDEKIKAVLLWAWHFFWAKFYHKPVYLYANSIGPLNSILGRFITKKVLQKADFITVRDFASAEILKKFQIKNFEITSDPAFLTPVPPEILRKKQVAISLRHWIKDERKYISALKTIIPKLEKQGYHILLISMQNFQDDDRLIFSLVSSEKSLTITPCDLTELVAILQKCDFTIGMRLHFLIASALANTPFVTLSYSQKTTALAQTLGMADFLLPVESVTAETLEKMIQKMLADKKTLTEKLKQNTETEKQKSQQNSTIFELIFKKQK